MKIPRLMERVKYLYSDPLLLAHCAARHEIVHALQGNIKKFHFWKPGYLIGSMLPLKMGNQLALVLALVRHLEERLVPKNLHLLNIYK